MKVCSTADELSNDKRGVLIKENKLVVETSNKKKKSSTKPKYPPNEIISFINRAIYAIADGTGNCGPMAILALVKCCEYAKKYLDNDDFYCFTFVHAAYVTQEEVNRYNNDL